ncbi:nucleotidyl transferase AbiEii/AbiGii toxin family protein [Endozoicomonas sp. Mp262]|uniref:nucleotidyl transferase AbiEii/AbiGii toxin family protein n=1 Tax=Endozoicomonas sp. Mp262 TaxID=2919499 RepID=UPI0021D8CD35
MTEHEMLLLGIADALGSELLEEVAFVGGATVSLHLDNAQPMDIRSTKDVDFIVSVTSYGDFQRLATQLKERGFKEDSQPEDDSISPICRFVCNGVIVDVMPDEEKILGFSNPWFQTGREQAIPYTLPGHITIRVVPAPYLLATKLAAYFSRGTDILESKDAEDIVILVNGRDALVDEILSGPEDLRDYVRGEMHKFISDSSFDYLLDSALNGEEAERYDMIEERFFKLAGRELND